MLSTETAVAAPHQLIQRMAEARRQSDALFNVVREGYLYERPIPERHRIVFYVGHLEAFDWNLLKDKVSQRSGLKSGLRSVHPEFDRLFAFGIDPVGGGLPTDVPSDWPSLDAVADYVRNIRGALDNALADSSLETDSDKSESHADDDFSLSTLLNVAVEHRLMHAETLAYMLHQLPIGLKVRPVEEIHGLASVTAQPVIHRGVTVHAGTTTLGLPGSIRKSDGNFGWDNEYSAHTVEVPAFEIDRYKVTNRKYLEFIAAGGYDTRDFWSDDDWDWKTAHRISHPAFWKRDGDRWVWRGMFAESPFDEVVLDWPVYVSQAEANAYTRWAGKLLPTEEQWQRAAYGDADGEARAYPWGNQAPDLTRGNFDFSRWDPVPVNAFPEGQSAFGVHDLLGNGWEWTSTAFAPFPGFEPFPFYRGYSADFFDGKHFVMKGGSARTAACMLRPTFRNWFQAHYQYAYAGFRCVNG